jgi:hypothetical protein
MTKEDRQRLTTQALNMIGPLLQGRPLLLSVFVSLVNADDAAAAAASVV